MHEGLLYFSNGKTRTAGIGLLINETEFTIDTDGRGESVFQKRVASRFPPDLQSKINSTMCTKTPHGYHRIFRYGNGCRFTYV